LDELTAVLPAAGMGTRLRPLTEHIPKEMLPVGRRPVIGHVLEEVQAAGIRRAVIVIAPGKEILRSYCGDGGAFGVQCSYAVQETMHGVGDAVLCAVAAGAAAPLLVAFADCAILPMRGQAVVGGSARLIEAFTASGADAAVLCEQVAAEQTRHYGVLDPCAGSDLSSGEAFTVRGIVEKPEPDRAPSRWVVAARWVLGPAAVEAIAAQAPGSNGEVGVTEAISALIESGGRVVAVPLGAAERRLDVGNYRSFLAAQAYAALNDPEYGEEVEAWLTAGA